MPRDPSLHKLSIASNTVLGLRWNTHQDTLVVKRGATLALVGNKFTQRIVLSILSFQSYRTSCSVYHKSSSTFEINLDEIRINSQIVFPRASFSKSYGLYELHFLAMIQPKPPPLLTISDNQTRRIRKRAIQFS